MDIIKYMDYKNIYAVDCFDKEFKRLFDPSSLKRYLEWLRRNLHNLDEKKKTIVDNGHVEKLYSKGYNIYSIRYPQSKCNPRVLFYITPEGDCIILLCAMLEKSSNDYTKALNKAIKRIKEVE